MWHFTKSDRSVDQILEDSNIIRIYGRFWLLSLSGIRRLRWSFFPFLCHIYCLFYLQKRSLWLIPFLANQLIGYIGTQNTIQEEEVATPNKIALSKKTGVSPATTNTNPGWVAKRPRRRRRRKIYYIAGYEFRVRRLPRRWSYSRMEPGWKMGLQSIGQSQLQRQILWMEAL